MKKGRKISGGRYQAARKKKSYETKGRKKVVRLGDDIRKVKRVAGGKRKTILFKTKFVNISTKGKTKRAEIKNVLETPSERFLARQNIMTKGTIVETDLGKVKITGRPSQEGIANGVLVE